MNRDQARGCIHIINAAYTHIMATHMQMASLELPEGGEIEVPPLGTGLISVAQLIQKEFLGEEAEDEKLDSEVLDSMLDI